MNKRTAAVAGIGVLACTLLGGSSISATASSDPLRPGPLWHRYHQQNVMVPAGEGCHFRVFEKVLYDREYYKTVATYDNGSPRTQLFRGPLVMRFKNLRSGAAVTRNLSGRAFFEYGRRGSFSLTVQDGHFGAGVHPGGTPETGIFYVGGKWSSLIEDQDGTRHLVLGPHGTSENLCHTLS